MYVPDMEALGPMAWCWGAVIPFVGDPGHKPAAKANHRDNYLNSYAQTSLELRSTIGCCKTCHMGASKKPPFIPAALGPEHIMILARDRRCPSPALCAYKYVASLAGSVHGPPTPIRRHPACACPHNDWGLHFRIAGNLNRLGRQLSP